MPKKVMPISFILVLIFSAALRIFKLGSQSYWIDEMVSLHFAEHPHWGALFWDNTPFFYHLLLKGWTSVVGDSESATRSLSVIFSVTATGLVFLLGQRLAGLRGAIVCSILQATSVLSVAYSQETRMYALLEAATAFHLLCFVRYWKSDRGKGLFIFSGFLLCLSHYLGFIPLTLEAAFIYFVLPKKNSKASATALCLGGAFVVLSYLNFFSWPHLQWQQFKFHAEPGSHWPTQVLWAVGNRSWLCTAAYLILIATFIYSLRKRKAEPKTFLLFMSLGPILIFMAATFILQRSMFLPRYFIYLLPYFLTWATLQWLSFFEGKRNKKILAGFVALLWFIGTLQALPTVYLNTKSPWREAAQRVALEPESIVITTRTNAIETPYFKKNHIFVEKWNIATEGLQKITELLKKYPHVWVVENYYGAVQYFDRLEKALDKQNLVFKDQSVSSELAEPVRLLLIERPK